MHQQARVDSPEEARVAFLGPDLDQGVQETGVLPTQNRLGPCDLQSDEQHEVSCRCDSHRGGHPPRTGRTPSAGLLIVQDAGTVSATPRACSCAQRVRDGHCVKNPAQAQTHTPSEWTMRRDKSENEPGAPETPQWRRRQQEQWQHGSVPRGPPRSPWPGSGAASWPRPAGSSARRPVIPFANEHGSERSHCADK